MLNFHTTCTFVPVTLTPLTTFILQNYTFLHQLANQHLELSHEVAACLSTVQFGELRNIYYIAMIQLFEYYYFLFHQNRKPNTSDKTCKSKVYIGKQR